MNRNRHRPCADRRPRAGRRGCGGHVHGDVQVARLGPPRSPALPFPGTRTRSPSAIAGRDPHLHRLGARLLSAARRTVRRPRTLLPAAAARRCSSARTPCARGRCARPPAPWHTRHAPGAHPRHARAGAGAAGLAARDGDRPLRSRERLVERELHRLVQVGAALRRRLPRRRVRTALRRTRSPNVAA